MELLPRDNLLPLVSMLQIPQYRLINPIRKLRLRKTSHFLLNPRQIDSITQIMTLSLCNICHYIFTLSKLLDDKFHNIDARYRVIHANIIDFSNPPLMNNQIDCLAMILHIDPIPHILALAIIRERLVGKTFCNHKRNHVSRKNKRHIFSFTFFCLFTIHTLKFLITFPN